MRLPVHHKRLGRLDLLRSPISLSRAAQRGEPTPERGEHTIDVLSEFGLTAEQIASLRAQNVV
jgi:formyl-CoA transferase